MSKKNLVLILVTVLIIALIGGICLIFAGRNNTPKANNNRNTGSSNVLSSNYDSNYRQEDIFANGEIPNVEITFGYDGETFVAEMENNETAIELVRNITSSGRNLPIYNYDDFEGYEYMQYYDIPSRYNIPSNPVQVTNAKAGEIYYSTPNRVIIFYQDAEVNSSYTKIGEIKDTNGLRKAVEDNPVLEGWGNKIISVNYAK